jgi:hypothetical protein
MKIKKPSGTTFVFAGASIWSIAITIALFVRACSPQPQGQQHGFLGTGGQFLPGTQTNFQTATIANATLTSATITTLTNSGSLSLTGEQTFSTTGTSENITLNANTAVFRYTGGSTASFGGFTGGTTGRLILIVNESGSTVTLLHQSAGSSSGNKITNSTSLSTFLTNSTATLIRYDGTNWRPVSSSSNTLGVASINGQLFLAANAGEQTSTITGSNNNVALATSSIVFRWNGASAATMTGLTGSGARTILVVNESTTNSLTLTNQDGASTATNDFVLPQSASLVYPPGAAGWLRYDGSASRWRALSCVGCYSQASNTSWGYAGSLPRASGRYYITPPSAPSASSALGQNNVRCLADYFSQTVTLTRIGTGVTVIGDVGSKVRLGIYGDDGTGWPGTLVVDAGQIAGDSATDQELTISTAIGPGWYWFCGVVQSAATTQPTVRVPTAPFWIPPGMPAAVSMAGTASAPVAATMAGVSGALPTTFTAFSGTAGGTAPRIFVKY